jgi:two-component system sensor histidine kinase/response regulator
MVWEEVFYISASIAGILISLGVARYAWKHRSVPGAEYFALYNLCAVQWAFSSILAVVATSPGFRDFWGLFGMIGIFLNPVMWLAFTLEYTGRERPLTARTLTLIAIVPVIALLLIESAGIYQVARGLEIAYSSAWAIFVFLITSVYVTALLLISTLFIIQELIRARRRYRGRYITLLIGVWAPWVFGVMALFGLNQFSGQLLPVGYALGSLIAAWGIFRYQVFDIMPIALDTVIESIGDGVIVLDTQDRIVELNPAAQQIVNLSAERASGLSIEQALGDWKELMYRLDQEQPQAVTDLQEPVRSRKDAAQADVIRGPDEGYYELRVSALVDRYEALSGRLILLHDISARVQAEEELRQVNEEIVLRNRDLMLLNRVITATTSELEPKAVLETVCRELALAFGAPQSAAALLNEERTELNVVAEYRSLTSSAKPSEAPTSALGNTIPVEGNPATIYVLEHKAPLAVAEAQRDPRLAPVHHLMRQRNTVSLLILPVIVRGEVMGTVGLDTFQRREFTADEISLATSVTAAAAQALEKAWAEEALRESEERHRSVSELTSDFVYRVNVDAKASLQLDWATDALLRVTGYSPQELIARGGWTTLVHPDDLPRYQERRNQILASGESAADEYRIIPKNGQVCWLRDYWKPEWDAQQERVVRILGAASDITERKEAEEELRESKAVAEEARVGAESANRAKSVFLANMSHELRTPLNAILGFARLMTRDQGLTAEQRENLETIGRSGEHLLGLINDVLELSKIEAGRVALQKESFDLFRLLDGLEEMFHLRATEKSLMLIFDRAPDVPQYVRTDEGKLRQVLMNLLGNAVKFTQEGGATLRIGYSNLPGCFTQESFQEGKPRLLFEVEDTGPGIAPEELDAVFDPFKQTASGQMSHEGTGLGMPISRQFVTLMGGDLTFSSESGAGSIFKFDVQIELADAADTPLAQPMRRVIGLEPEQPVYRLLVAEDREPSRRLLVKLLAPLGFELREAANGQEAIEIWQRWKPHLIWMDMRMPVMDGHEATQRIKATTQGQATVIVALTASAFESDRAMILSGGCDGYVRKPFREEEIFDTLAQHLGVRFVYEEGAQPIGVPTEDAEGLLTTVALAALPADWVTSLHQAANQLDGDLILGLLDQIREQNAPLADALASLVHNFRFDTIMTLTEPMEG